MGGLIDYTPLKHRKVTFVGSLVYPVMPPRRSKTEGWHGWLGGRWFYSRLQKWFDAKEDFHRKVVQLVAHVVQSDRVAFLKVIFRPDQALEICWYCFVNGERWGCQWDASYHMIIQDFMKVEADLVYLLSTIPEDTDQCDDFF